VVVDILKECVNMDLEPFKMEVTVSFKMSDTTQPVMQCHITDDMYSCPLILSEFIF